jgi:hypothetical protein
MKYVFNSTFIPSLIYYITKTINNKLSQRFIKYFYEILYIFLSSLFMKQLIN